jgi:anaerobic dimethyl sulfoxide reductase subunit B (iron-sulfur subunit)
MQMAFYFDQTRCTGCFTCTVACKDWHDIPAGPASWRRVKEIGKGRFPNVFVAYLLHGCWHCANPSCVSVCPVSAISKRAEDGIVLIDRDACLGRDNCDLCLKACPYEAPQFGVEPNAKMQKCNFCTDRLAEGKKPICVDACPMRALDAGPIDILASRYGDCRDAEGFVYSTDLEPSVIFKLKLVPAAIRRRALW